MDERREEERKSLLKRITYQDLQNELAFDPLVLFDLEFDLLVGAFWPNPLFASINH